jgi:hypothetical protein
MYIQLYRSKVQFYRKFGGAARANRYKLLVTVAYLPRLAASALAAPLGPAWAARCRIYGRLLAALPGM